jgi:hypothetical protein
MNMTYSDSLKVKLKKSIRSRKQRKKALSNILPSVPIDKQSAKAKPRTKLAQIGSKLVQVETTEEAGWRRAFIERQQALSGGIAAVSLPGRYLIR